MTFEEMEQALADAKVAIEARDDMLGKLNAALTDATKAVITPEAAEKMLSQTRTMRFSGSTDPAPRDTNRAIELGIGQTIFERRSVSGLNVRIPDRFEAEVRAMTTGGSGTGAELLAVDTLARLWDDVRIAAKVAGLFGPALNMTTQTVKVPLGLGSVAFKKPAGEGQAVTATDLATASKDLAAKVIKGQVDVSDEIDEDSVVALLPAIRSVLVRCGAEALDDVIINADTTTGTGNINYNGASIAADSLYLLGFDGLMHLCLVDNTDQGSDVNGALDKDKYIAILKLLQKYVVDPSRCALIADLGSYLASLTIAEFLTMDKIGAKATILTGQLGAVYGVPVVVSGQIAKSAAAGYIDGATPANNTKGRVLLVNRDSWLVGSKAGLSVESERSVSKGLTSIVVRMRPALTCYGAVGSAYHTALGYNVTI